MDKGVALDKVKMIDTIIQGDCIEIMKDIPDKSIDLVLTDIPYNISQIGNGLRNLDYGSWDYQKGYEDIWINEIERVAKSTIIVFCHKKQFSILLNFLEDREFLTRTIVWHKPNPTVINCDKSYIEATELAIYAKRRGSLFKPTYKHNVFNYKYPDNREHPTQKPIRLFMEFISDCTNENDLVLDPFLGSGTTAVACVNLKRHFIGIEKEQEYVDIANKRVADAIYARDSQPELALAGG